ncbi:unnamed protein product [Notodromas monacha]|uniref:UBA domain-containing protein n=1 Tax=Notodromas monacha TaxID=399045 RepID=A0A7R9GAX4_9CRUS|nr:unnamed protein product [Notodromas monacha]CAG0914450.1 unnamed protein product [Notodromas monacha]
MLTVVELPIVAIHGVGFEFYFSLYWVGIMSRITATLETPVLVVPMGPNSPDVLVARLGRIFVRNAETKRLLLPHSRSSDFRNEEREQNVEDETVHVARYEMLIQDMNLHNMNLEEKMRYLAQPFNEAQTSRTETFQEFRSPNARPDAPWWSRLRTCDIFDCKTPADRPILHDTRIHIDLGFFAAPIFPRVDGKPRCMDDPKAELCPDVVQVNISLVDSLKISLSKTQYQMILRTLEYAVNFPGHADRPVITKERDIVNVISESSDVDFDAASNDGSSAQLDDCLAYSGKKSSILVKGNFEVPQFIVQLKGDPYEGEQAIVSLSLNKFVVDFEATAPFESKLEISLFSIIMEDLTEPEDSVLRTIMLSHGKMRESNESVPRRNILNGPVSVSCPDLSSTIDPTLLTYFSMPENLDTQNVFRYFRKQTRKGSTSASTTVYEVSNSNFLGTNADERPAAVENPSSDAVIASSSAVSLVSGVETRDLFKVVDGDLAQATICNFQSNMNTKDGNVEMNGGLGSLALCDLSKNKGCYRQKFRTAGKEVLHFHFFKHKDSDFLDAVDDREFDAHLKLNMSSVVYVHTHRFMTNVIDFFTSFSDLQKVLGRLRAGAVGAELFEKPRHGFRCLLDLKIDNPVIIIPHSAGNPQGIVVDLGQITASNSFKVAGSEDCISYLGLKTRSNAVRNRKNSVMLSAAAACVYPCLMDVIRIDLVNMDVFVAEILAFDSPEPRMRKRHAKPVQESDVITFGLSYRRKTSPPASILSGDEKEVWTTFALIVDLKDVSLRAKWSHSEKNPLAKINFIQSRLTIESHTDNSRDIDLVSQEIRLHDLRHADDPLNPEANRFKRILQPIKRSEADAEKKSAEKSTVFQSKTSMQAEVHFRQSKTFTRLTVLLNSMRLLAIFDWWRAVLDFITTRPDPPVNYSCDHQTTAKEDKSTQEPQKADSFLVPPTEGEFVPMAPNPIQTSTGIYSKREISPPVPAFELKLNITDSEIVALENCQSVDTNAVILKTTAVISHRPDFPEKPLSVNLSNCEVFSCLLGTAEEDTALSIIEPVALNLEISAKKKRKDGTVTLGLQDATPPDFTEQTLEVVFPQHFKIRLSYNDMKMFLRIFNSLQIQAKRQVIVEEVRRNSLLGQKSSLPVDQEDHVQKLKSLGFTEEDCLKALRERNGKLDESALWLLENAVPVVTTDEERDGLSKEVSESNPKSDYSTVEVRLPCLSVCVIDDCKDSDVPLVDFTFDHLAFTQDLRKKEGSLNCTVSGDFYNRDLSAWEPVLEPWKLESKWNIQETVRKRDIVLEIRSLEILNLNITSSLIDLLTMVSKNWKEDYYQASSLSGSVSHILNKESKTSGVSPSENTKQFEVASFKRRSPFVPFALKNETGSTIWFRGSGSGISISSANDSRRSAPNIVEVSSGATESFSFKASFYSEERIRARIGADNKKDPTLLSGIVHQIIVKVDGWSEAKPVTIDKLGVYFREVVQDTMDLEKLISSMLIFSVSTEGSARKLVTVRSAFSITNRMNEVVEIKLDLKPLSSSSSAVSGTNSIKLFPGETYPVPLKLCQAQCGVFLRPVLEVNPYKYGFGKAALPWNKVVNMSEPQEVLHLCKPLLENQGNPFRLCASIIRLPLPIDHIRRVSPKFVDQPMHSIVLKPPITIFNSLPYVLFYSLSSIDPVDENRTERTEGLVLAGKEAAVHEIDLAERLSVGVWTEHFQKVSDFHFSPRVGSTYATRVTLFDSEERPLELDVKMTPRQASIKITVSSPFWLVNRTGLPLIFKQDGISQEFAGQSREHEVGRSVEPLLFSLSDPSSPFMVARVGKDLHPNGIPQVPGMSFILLWSKNFNLGKPGCVRRLRVALRDSQRPDIVYSISVRIQPGSGRYRDTKIVTFSPMFQIFNRSSHSLQFAQKKFAVDYSQHSNAMAELTYLEAKQNSHVAFHWPRDDLDQLLCVRMADVFRCRWSGAFPLEKIQSFYLNLRDFSELSMFLRVEIILEGATFYVIFMDAAVLPPPLRIDNFSEVTIKYHQNGVEEIYRQSDVRPHSSQAYAWDEPTFRQMMVVSAPGGVATVVDMTELNLTASLSYENFLYLALSCTFSGEYTEVLKGEQLGSNSLDKNLQLVLDVEECSTSSKYLSAWQKKYKIVLKPKQLGQRSQLWRMTTDGKLAHEGTSPPRDPKHPNSSKEMNRVLVLDIDSKAVLPDEYMPLTLRPPDGRRTLTQHWRFTEDGRLCCMHANLCVQAKDGFRGIIAGTEVVLGPIDKRALMFMENGVPVEQAISRQRLRPGSGFLHIIVTSDGPTRVLQIKDFHQKNQKKHDWIFSPYSNAVVNGTSPNSSRDRTWPFDHFAIHGIRNDRSANGKREKSLRLNFHLASGIGVSVVSHGLGDPEELAYAMFSNVIGEIIKSDSELKIDGSIENIQVDNPSIDAQVPVILSVISASKEDGARSLPYALHFNIHQVSAQFGSTSVKILKHFMLTLKPLIVNIEEKQLCKFILFFNLNKSDSELEDESGEDTMDCYSDTSASVSGSAEATRYYLGLLKITLCQIRLSVYRSTRMAPALLGVKRRLGLTLIQFEDAYIEFHPFVKSHVFETLNFVVQCLMKHYAEDFFSQLAKIVGSTDILGNPVGFLSDVTEGLSDLSGGNVAGLVKNVTHGFANSTAKFTGTISDAVGMVTLDERHEIERQRIKSLPQFQKRIKLARYASPPPNDSDAALALTVRTGEDFSSVPSSAFYEHLRAGLEGLRHGVFGGVRSLVSQTYYGYQDDGVVGMVSGFGKGFVGTVTKPALGVLDFATETANAVRDHSRSESRLLPSRVRPPRVLRGANAALPRYSSTQALGQEFLLFLNKKDTSEMFIAFERLREGAEDMAALISSQLLRVLTRSGPESTYSVVVEFNMSDIDHAEAVVNRAEAKVNSYYIKLAMKSPDKDSSGDAQNLPIRRPLVQCDTEVIAKKVTRLINLAKGIHDELLLTLKSGTNSDEQDDA